MSSTMIGQAYDGDECGGECIQVPHVWGVARCDVCGLVGTGDECNDGDCEAIRDAFRRGYVWAMLWQTGADVGAYMSPGRWWEDVGVPTDDADDFLTACYDDLRRIAGAELALWEQHGGDFALTRNRHGAGFWDRGYGEVGDRLTEAAHAFGEAWLIVTDDGEVLAD